MTPRALEEYRALRDTIGRRGTARAWILLAGLVAWAGLTVATAALAELPIATLLPLLILALTFEISYWMHTGVERVGRYLQVFFEGEPAERGWEHYAMEYGRRFPRNGIDPLFTPHFLIATIFNFVPVLLAGAVPIEWGSVGTIHVLFVVRVLVARRESGRQRAVDLERFRRLKSTTTEDTEDTEITKT